MYRFAPSKPFGNLVEISPQNHIFLKIFNSEFQTIEVWFTDQNSQPLQIGSNKYSQKLIDSAKKSTTDAEKNASKKAIQKTAEAIGGLIGDKIAAKITSISKSLKELHSKEIHSTEEDNNEIPKER